MFYIVKYDVEKFDQTETNSMLEQGELFDLRFSTTKATNDFIHRQQYNDSYP